MLRRVEDQRRVKNGEAQRREDLNEEQRSRSLRSRREPAFEKLHPAAIWTATLNNVKTSDGTCRLVSSLDPQSRRGRGSNGALRSQLSTAS